MKNPSFTNLSLLIPDKEDIERNAVADVWKRQGGEVLRIGRFWEPPEIEPAGIRVYGNNTFCWVLAQKYDLKLVSPKDEFLFAISESWLKRKIQLTELAAVDQIIFPCFMKPLVPKLFTTKVYESKGELLSECHQLEDTTKLIISEIVNIRAEVRAFILQGRIMTIACYEGEENIDNCRDFLMNFINQYHDRLEKTLVIDVGYFEDKGWGIIEVNATWGAGLNGCDPEGAARCIANATKYLPTGIA